MPESLPDAKAIANHLTRQGREVMIYKGRVEMRVIRILGYPGAVVMQFRSTRILRVILSLPVEVTDKTRDAFALWLARTNRRQLGAGFVMTSGIVFKTQVPTERDGGVLAAPLDRAIELAIESVREARPEVERIAATGHAAL